MLKWSVELEAADRIQHPTWFSPGPLPVYSVLNVILMRVGDAAVDVQADAVERKAARRSCRRLNGTRDCRYRPCRSCKSWSASPTPTVTGGAALSADCRCDMRGQSSPQPGGRHEQPSAALRHCLVVGVHKEFFLYVLGRLDRPAGCAIPGSARVGCHARAKEFGVATSVRETLVRRFGCALCRSASVPIVRRALSVTNATGAAALRCMRRLT